jgi:vitamin B12 transporter
VIDSEQLESSQNAVISDLLATVPGVRVARSGGPGSQTSVFILGANSSQTLVLVDGVRINDPSTPNGLFDFGALLTGNIDRVEVLRGPNSVIWGSQAIGGVVNIRTLEPAEAFEVRARGEYGYSDTSQLQANVAGTSGIVSGSIGGGIYRTDGISALTGGTERDGYKNVSANGKLKIDLSEDVALDLRGYYNDGDGEYDNTFPISPNSLPEFRNKQFLGYVGLNAALFDGALQNRLSYSRTDLDRVGTDPDPFSFSNFDVNGSLDRFEYQGRFQAGEWFTAIFLDIVFGLEHEESRAQTSFAGFPADRFNNDVTSGYAQAILKSIAGLTVTAGVRHDDYKIYGSKTTFGANFAYMFNDENTVLRGTYAEGFRAPTFSEGLPPFGNPDLKPETAKSFDLGIEHSFLDKAVTVSATWFSRKSRDLIGFDNSFTPQNIDRARASGLELSLAARPSDTLSLSAAYSYVDTENRSTTGFSAFNFGNELPRRAKHSAALSADWTTPWKMALGTTVQIVGDSFNNAANTQRLDGYTLAGIRASYPVMDGVSVFGRVENLFDVDYAMVAEGTTPYGSYGRNAYIGVRLSF